MLLLHAILSSDPQRVSEEQLRVFYRSIVDSRDWACDGRGNCVEFDSKEKDPFIFIVRFCKGNPMFLDAISEVYSHLKDELTWTDHACLMRSAVKEKVCKVLHFFFFRNLSKGDVFF